MAKGVQKHEKDMKKSLYHHGLIKMIITYELQKQNLSWQQFLIDNEFEAMKEEHEEEEFIPVDDEEDVEVHIIMNHEATSSKQPMRTRRMTWSMVKEEEEFQEKDRPFRTYTRKWRKFPRI
jgi:hypothetical protein